MLDWVLNKPLYSHCCIAISTFGFAWIIKDNNLEFLGNTLILSLLEGYLPPLPGILYFTKCYFYGQSLQLNLNKTLKYELWDGYELCDVLCQLRYANMWKVMCM